MVRRVAFVMLVGAVPVQPAVSAQPAVAVRPAVAAVATSVAQGDILQAFFAELMKGDSNAAVQDVLGSSPLWSQRPGMREAMIGQIDASVKAYGPVVAVEKVKSEDLGTMVRRQIYCVQHRDMVVRWEFDMVRVPTGWMVGYFAMNDQPNTWF